MQCFLRENEILTVGSVQIKVLEIQCFSIKLGITDPNASPTYREETLYVRSDDAEEDDNDAVEMHEVFQPITTEDFSRFATVSA